MNISKLYKIIGISITTTYRTFKIIFFSLFNKDYFNFFYREVKKWSDDILNILRTDLEVSGLDNIDTNESYIYIANHTHLLDIPILIKSIKTDNIHFVYRKSLQKVPVLGLALKKSPFIPIIRESNKNAMDSINQATELLKTRSIIMFPEGTRSDDGITKKFKRGAFLLAASTNKKIVPISISYPLPIPDSNDFSYSDLKNLNLKKIYVQINNPIESIPVDRSEQNLFIDDIQKLIAHQVQSNKNKLR